MSQYVSVPVSVHSVISASYPDDLSYLPHVFLCCFFVLFCLVLFCLVLFCFLEEKCDLPEIPKHPATKFAAPKVDQYQLQHQHSFEKVGCQPTKLSAKKHQFFHLVLPKNF